MSWLDGEDNKASVLMYKGRAMGISFPRDGNKHHDSWAVRKYPVLIQGQEKQITINTYENGDLISIEVDLPDTINILESESR